MSAAHKAQPKESWRIARLPYREPDWSQYDMNAALRTPKGTMVLNPIQSAALAEAAQEKGAICPIGVGVGKTLISCLLPTVMNAQKPLLVVPPTTAQQTKRLYVEYRQHFKIKQITFLTYSRLSTAKGTDILYRLKPDLIICDEVHLLKDPNSARTMRVLRFLADNPQVMFVALSGTMTKDSLKNYSHLAELALRDGSPLPRDKYTLGAWCKVLDANDDEPNESDWQELRPMIDQMHDSGWQGFRRETETDYERRHATARECFSKRFRGTPGVICSSNADVDASLYISTVKDIPYPKDLYDLVKETKERPDGEPLEDDARVWLCLRQLSLGFYYIWHWGDREPDWEWVDAYRGWGREVRAEISDRATTYYDSPWLVEKQILKLLELDDDDDIVAVSEVLGHEPSPMLVDAWREWDRVRHRKGPDTVPVWIDDTPLRRILALGSTKHPTIYWYHSDAVADRIEQISDIHVVRAGEEPPEEALWCALSIKSHGTGLNLQRWAHNVLIEPPPGNPETEQCIGRTHRQGQAADEVHFTIPVHSPVFAKALRNAREEAAYQQDTMKMPQRLCYAVYDEQ